MSTIGWLVFCCVVGALLGRLFSWLRPVEPDVEKIVRAYEARLEAQAERFRRALDAGESTLAAEDCRPTRGRS